MSGRLAAFVLAAAAATTVGAHAEPGGTSGVSGPSVTQGELKFEVRTTAFNGGALDGAWSHRAQVGYGVTDWWRPQLNLRASQPDGADAELRSVGFENTFEFTPTNDWPVRFGGQIEYKIGVNGAEDEVDLKLLAERRVGNFSARFNFVAGRQVGSDSDEWDHEYRTRLMWRVSDAFDVGVEGFGEIDADAHAWGPRAVVSLGQTAVSLGYLVGFGDARSDGQLRLGLEWKPGR